MKKLKNNKGFLTGIELAMLITAVTIWGAGIALSDGSPNEGRSKAECNKGTVSLIQGCSVSR